MDEGKTYAVREAVTVREISANSEGSGIEYIDTREGREKTEPLRVARISGCKAKKSKRRN